MAHVSFARLLRRMRMERGLAQADVSRDGGINHSLVSRLEAGSRAPTRNNLDELCRGLHLSPWECERLYRSAGYVYNVNAAPLLSLARDSLTNYEFDESIVNHLDQAWQNIVLLAVGAQEATQQGWKLSSYSPI